MNIKTCEIMQYTKFINGFTKESFFDTIKKLTNLKTACLIVHDKDTKPDGTLKEPHIHAVLTFSNNKTTDSIAKALGIEEQYISKIHSATKTAQLYLVHRNDQEKHQYEASEVLSYGFDYQAMAEDCPPKVNKQKQMEIIAEAIANGEIKRYNLNQRVSAVEYAQNKPFYERCFEYRQERIKENKRDMECYFITGGSGTGKTTYAKMIAESMGYHAYVSDGGKNPLDNYRGEECIILDDIRPSSWSLADFLKLTDNNTPSMVGCRYYNKSIAECKLIICTSVLDLDEFYTNAIKETETEPRKQLYRRFKMRFIMTDERITVTVYEPAEGKFKRQGSIINPVYAMRNPKVAEDIARKFLDAMGAEFESNPCTNGQQQNYTELSGEEDLPF